MVLVFLSGLGVMLYPHVRGYLVDHRIERQAEEFLSWVEIAPFVSDSSESHVIEINPAGPAIPEPTEPNEYVDLWYAMMNYNRDIYLKGQEDLDCEYAYEKPSFKLKDYGLESSTRFTGTGQWPPGDISAKRVSLININEKNRDERNAILVSWSLRIM